MNKEDFARMKERLESLGRRCDLDDPEGKNRLYDELLIAAGLAGGIAETLFVENEKQLEIIKGYQRSRAADARKP